MKKFLFFAAAVIMMAAGCQKQELNPVTDGDTTVTFTVSTGEIATKAIADGTNIDVLYWEIYQDLTEKALGEGKVLDNDGNKEFTVELKLLADQEYNIVFWAQVDGQNHYVVDDLRSVEIKTYDDEMANDETRAAFFAVHNFSTENGVAIKEDVILRRPFSQLNLGATTLETSLNLVNNGQLEVKTTQVVVTNIATSFNTVAGEGEGEQAVTFKHEKTPVDYTQQLLTVNGETYHWLGMNYLIVNGEADNVVVDIEVETSVGKVNHTVSNVPIKENYRTNILGNLLTTGAEFTVIIDEKFDGDYYGPDFLKTPAYNEQTKTWNVTEKYELLWVADQVNNKANTFKGETVQITSDIDLAGMNWTPIASTGLFEGIFEGASMTKSGAGYPTIKNLTVATEGRAYAGLFASCRGTIRNINLANVNITGHYKAGAISGDGLCAKIENCHVDGAVIVSTPYNNDDANHVGGIVGYLSAEPTAYVKNCSVKNAEIKAYRDAGGIAGMANGASVVTGNSVENVTVTADQTAAYVDNTKDGNAGAIVGRIDAKATVEPNTVGENVVVYRKVDSTEEMAHAVADAKSGDTIYVGNGEVALPHFENKALSFVGIHSDAAILEPVSSHIDAFWQGSELNFTDLKIKGTSYTGKANGYVKSAKETYTGCAFVDGYYMFAGDVAIVNDCVFTGKYNSYFWTGSADDITFNECKFNGVERIVKVCTVGHTGVERDVTFNDCQFTATEQKKAAIEIDGTKGSSYVVNINRCTETGFAKGEFTDLAMFNIEGADNVQVYLDGAKWFRNGVMEENDELFAYSAAGLQYLLDNAVDGETVKVGADIEGDVTVTQKADVKIAIEGNNHKYAGVITVDGKSATYKTAGVTIKNLNFEAETISADACIRLGISGNTNTRYTCNVAVEGCKFAVPGAVAVKSYTGGDHNLSIKNCTGAGIHSLTQLPNVTGVTIEGVNITGGRGASFGQSSNIVVKNSTFVAESYGLRVDAKSEAVLAIENVNITAKLPVVARKTSENYTINFTGVNNLVADGYQVVFTTGDDEAAFVAPAEYTLTGAEGFKVFPRDADTYNYVYNADELQAAIDAGKKSIVLQPGKYEKTINLKSDVTIEGLEGAIVNCINLNGADNVTLKNIAFDAAGAQMAYDGKGNERYMANIMSGGASKNGSGTQGLVVEGCTFTGTFANGGTVIAFNDRNRGSGQSGDITIKGCTFATEGAYVDIYTYYSGKGKFIIENNTFNSTVSDKPIYLGRYQSSTPVVVKGNAFNKCADFAAAAYIQAHSTAYTVSFDESGNTFAE